jgi:hypothetical protein
VAATASVMMRAFRALDSSFHIWRAGAYDPTMSDATGDQAPPFPVGDYSDFVVIGQIGGPLARSDNTAFSPAGLGTSGVPVVFPVAATPLVETSPGTDCQDFSSISYWVNVTTLAAGTSLTLRVYWGMEASPGGIADYGIQASDDQISAGVSPQAPYQAVYDLTGGITTAFGPFNVPVRGRYCRLTISSDNGLVQGYVRALRVA